MTRARYVPPSTDGVKTKRPIRVGVTFPIVVHRCVEPLSFWIWTGTPERAVLTVPLSEVRSAVFFIERRGATTRFTDGVDTLSLIMRYSAGPAVLSLTVNEPSAAVSMPRFSVQ